MSNANVFIIYQDGNGNVTLSTRHSSSEVMPTYDSAIRAELLAGSGVSNDVMTANIRCANCETWSTSGKMDFSGSSGGFIHARLRGSSLSTTNVQRSLSEHSSDGSFTWSFASAVGGSSTNPFVTTTTTSNSTTSTGGNSGNSGSSNTTTTTTTVNSGSESGSSGGKSTILWLHGILASVAFVLLFPFGGILIRVGNFPSLIWVHAGIQMLAWVVFAVGFGLGLYWGIIDKYMTEAHPIIGIALMVLMLFQPVLGWLHHRNFVRTGARSVSSYSHIWVGRTAIILGMINGGLGMQLSGVSKTYIIVYSVFAGIFGAAYLAAIAYGEMKRKKRVGSTASTGTSDHEMLASKERPTYPH